MLKFASRLVAVAAASGAVLALSACGVASPGGDTPPPPPQAYTPPPAASSLAGGPPPARGLAGGPKKPTRVVGMAPIPNPEDMSPADRARIYPNYKGGSRAVASHKPLRTWKRADGRTVVAMSPVANPEDMSARERRKVYGHRYDPAPRPQVAAKPRPHVVAAAKPAPVAVAKPAPAKPVVAAAKPAPVITPPPVKPAAVAAAPVAAAAAVAPAAKLALDPKLAKLQAAVGPAAVNGATLTVADSVAQGSSGKVTLTLAPDLFDIIKREAAKLGLTKAAKKTDVTATLTGDGYTVQPNGAQTAHLKSGEAATFAWLVTPGTGEKGPLTASVDASLKGSGKPQTFSLATIQRAIAPSAPAEAPKAKRGAFELPDVLSIPGMKTVSLPGIGAVPSKNVVTAVIALIILLLLVMVARGNSAARERDERRRKFRALTATEEPAAEPAHGHSEPVSYASGYSPPLTFSDPEPAPQHQTNYVNPMIAAAAGAAVGAAAMHAHDQHAHAETAHVEPVSEHHATPASHDHHDDHGHAEEAHVEDGHHAADGHGHDDHSHDAPAHDDHAHDSHAHDDHGHDDHGHVEHTAHAREPEHA